MLTFDDGPAPANDEKILAALAEQCVRATFFLIGKPASKNPELGAQDRGRRPHRRPSQLVASQI